MNFKILYKILYPYTAERRDVLGNTSPEAQDISRGRGFCTPRPERLPEGHLTRMSLGLFQDLAISFNVWYGTCLTNSSLYCIQCSVLGYSHIWYIDANLFKTVAEYVAGPVIMMSPGLCQGLAIYSVTANATINTRDFMQDIIKGRPRTCHVDVLRVMSICLKLLPNML